MTSNDQKPRFPELLGGSGLQNLLIIILKIELKIHCGYSTDVQYLTCQLSDSFGQTLIPKYYSISIMSKTFLINGGAPILMYKPLEGISPLSGNRW